MDIVTLGAALNGSAEYVNSHFKGGSNIQIVNNPDGTQTINASGEVSSEDTVAREAIVEHVLDKANPHEVTAMQVGLGNVDNTADLDKPVSTAVQTALSAKANTSDVYNKNDVDTALNLKQNIISDLSTIRSGAALGATAIQPISGKGLSTNDYTTAEKNKLAGIEAQANKTTVDSFLSGTSTNPVQNKVVKSALDGKQDSLTSTQLATINSGITSEDVAQIETNKNNISKDEDALVELVNSGAKNIWSPSWGTTRTMRGVTFTNNNDGTWTISGTSTEANAFCEVYSGTIPSALAGDAVCSMREYVADVRIIIYYYSADTIVKTIVVSDSAAAFAPPPTTDSIKIRIVVPDSGADFTAPVTIAPMICTEAAWDISQVYQQYRPSYQELYEMVKALQAN